MCFTDDEQLASAMRSLRNHGQGCDRYDNVRIGLNARMDTLQAAILLVKFSIFTEELQLRRRVADRYAELLESTGLSLLLPRIPAGFESSWAQYSVLADDSAARDRLRERLASADIPTAVYYPRPLHLQTAFAP